MQEPTFERICPRCGSQPMRSWHELTDDDRFVIERTTAAGETLDQRKKHRFCKRCWFEDRGDRTAIA